MGIVYQERIEMMKNYDEQEDLKAFMEENEDFKTYVMNNCRAYGWTIEHALRVREIKEYAKYLVEGKS